MSIQAWQRNKHWTGSVANPNSWVTVCVWYTHSCNTYLPLLVYIFKYIYIFQTYHMIWFYITAIFDQGDTEIWRGLDNIKAIGGWEPLAGSAVFLVNCQKPDNNLTTLVLSQCAVRWKRLKTAALLRRPASRDQQENLEHIDIQFTSALCYIPYSWSPQQTCSYSIGNYIHEFQPMWICNHTITSIHGLLYLL